MKIILQRLRYLMIALVFLLGLWLVWPNQPEKIDEKSELVKTPNGAISKVEQGQERHRPNRVKRVTEEVQTNPRIESILTDSSIGVTEAASIFRAMAADASLPLADRLDALTHGLNLDFVPFANFAETPDLPTELASNYMDAVINYNQSPKMQILAYLALLDHSDPEVVASAADMLAFAVGDDFNGADPAKLVQMAEMKLAELTQKESVDSR